MPLRLAGVSRSRHLVPIVRNRVRSFRLDFGQDVFLVETAVFALLLLVADLQRFRLLRQGALLEKFHCEGIRPEVVGLLRDSDLPLVLSQAHGHGVVDRVLLTQRPVQGAVTSQHGVHGHGVGPFVHNIHMVIVGDSQIQRTPQSSLGLGFPKRHHVLPALVEAVDAPLDAVCDVDEAQARVARDVGRFPELEPGLEPQCPDALGRVHAVEADGVAAFGAGIGDHEVVEGVRAQTHDALELSPALLAALGAVGPRVLLLTCGFQSSSRLCRAIRARSMWPGLGSTGHKIEAAGPSISRPKTLPKSKFGQGWDCGTNIWGAKKRGKEFRASRRCWSLAFAGMVSEQRRIQYLALGFSQHVIVEW